VLTGIASKTVIYLAQFFVSVLLVYYLLIDGENTIDKATHLLPERELILKFLDELKPIYHSLFNVYLITCMLTGFIAAVGFFLLGISYPILWGIAVAAFALLPLVGANLVYTPMAIYYLVIQDYMMGVAILVFGIIFLTVIPENIIRPRLAMKSASIHPAITLLSFAAPLFVIGSVGIVVGPALYGFLLAVYRTNIRCREEEEAEAALENREPVC
jgi:predicted PurR-regulated permease PerM